MNKKRLLELKREALRISIEKGHELSPWHPADELAGLKAVVCASCVRCDDMIIITKQERIIGLASLYTCE